jgi:hypothetical protein
MMIRARYRSVPTAVIEEAYAQPKVRSIMTLKRPHYYPR